MGNTFTGNSGTKGIIFLDTYPRTYYPVVIGSNTFTQNAGYLDSNVIFIRARGDVAQTVTTTIPNSNANLFCTGYHFESNTFTNNFGCSQKAGGPIRFECVDYAATQSSNNDRYTLTTLGAGVLTSYCAVNAASVFTASTFTTSYNGITYTVDFKKINFKANTYTGNFYSAGNSLIHLEGAPRVFFDTETFTNNGDNCREAINKYKINSGSTILSPAASEMTVAGALSAPGSYLGSTLG